MANPERGEVEFKVGEKKFAVKLTTNVARIAQPYMSGKTIFDINLLDMEYLPAVLFALCNGQNGINTIEDACALIDEDPITCGKAVDEAASLFFQKWSQKKAAKGPK